MNRSVEKPFSPACERNQAAIFDKLQQLLRHTDEQVLEIGSGTGQHAVYFGQKLPHICWQTSDVTANHNGINSWLQAAELDNVLPPLSYEIGFDRWPVEKTDVVFSANTLHIISEAQVKQLILDIGDHLKAGNRVLFYGPFKYHGEFTSASNAEFDLWLKDIDRLSGVRDFEVLEKLMCEQGFLLREDISMPANNQLLLFEKQANEDIISEP